MKKSQFLTLLLLPFFTICIHCTKKQPLDEDSIFSVDTSHSLPIEHSFGIGDEFTPRGNIIFRASKGANAKFLATVELNNEELSKLQHLVSENGFYFIRSPTKIGETLDDNTSSTSYVQTFVKACYLYGSGLKEVITVAVDYSGNVIGLNIVSPRSDCSADMYYSNPPVVFNSTVVVQQQVAGAAPDAQTFVKKLEQDAADQKSGKGKDNRSFLAKYWMYILPVFLILMLSTQAEQPAEGGGAAE